MSETQTRGFSSGQLITWDRSESVPGYLAVFIRNLARDYGDGPFKILNVLGERPSRRLQLARMDGSIVTKKDDPRQPLTLNSIYFVAMNQAAA